MEFRAEDAAGIGGVSGLEFADRLLADAVFAEAADRRGFDAIDGYGCGRFVRGRGFERLEFALGDDGDAPAFEFFLKAWG